MGGARAWGKGRCFRHTAHGMPHVESTTTPRNELVTRCGIGAGTAWMDHSLRHTATTPAAPPGRLTHRLPSLVMACPRCARGTPAKGSEAQNSSHSRMPNWRTRESNETQ